MRPVAWTFLAVLCVGVGVYPVRYLLGEARLGLLETKSETLLDNPWWRAGFRAHLVCGGVALAVGWAQFIRPWRRRFPQVHRVVGRLYVLTVCVSGTAAVCIAPFSSTGWVAALGFASLGVVWLGSTWLGYRSIRAGDLRRHERLMVYSYSACFAAVTLRVWLPVLIGVLRLDFSVAYPVVAWLCWVPNLLVAHRIASRG